MSEDYFKVEIRKSKTDQYRSGKEVTIAEGFTSACPYNMLLKYMSAASLDITTQAFLFRPAFRSSKGCKLISKDKQLSYTRARERIIKMLSSVAPNLNLGLHSLRAGGVTAAADNEVQDSCLKWHGRLKRSES